MAVPINEVADELLAQLQTATGYTFERRFAPYSDRASVANGKWIVFAAGDETEPRARKIDKELHTLDIVYQHSLPESSDEYRDPLDNSPWFLERLQIVENVKACFRVNGSLRSADFLGLQFSRMSNAPLYRPDVLTEQGIFASVVRLEFTGELE